MQYSFAVFSFKKMVLEISPERKSIYKNQRAQRSGREGRRSLCPVFGQMERTQHLKDCIHLRYVEDCFFFFCCVFLFWGGGSSGVTAARERFNWLATTKSVDNHKKAWITRGGVAFIYIYIIPYTVCIGTVHSM